MNKVEIYIGHERGVAVDFDGNEKRNEWVPLAIELADDEVIKGWRQTFDAQTIGGQRGGVSVHMGDTEQLVARTLSLVDAMFTEPEQKKAFKKFLKRELYGWFNEISARGPELFNAQVIE